MVIKSSFVSMTVFIMSLVTLSTYAICAFLLAGRSISENDASHCSKIVPIARVVNLVLICGTLLLLCEMLLNSIILSKTNAQRFLTTRSKQILAFLIGIANVMFAVSYHVAWTASCVFWSWTLLIFLINTKHNCDANGTHVVLDSFTCMWSAEVCYKNDVLKFYFVLLVICSITSAVMCCSSIIYLVYSGSMIHRPKSMESSCSNNQRITSPTVVDEIRSNNILITSPISNTNNSTTNKEEQF